jgi:perosamine synthetase
VKISAARVVIADDDRAEILRRVDDSLRTGSLTLGPNTRQFEEHFADRHRAAHAIATSSGTSALEIIVRSLDVAGKEVIVPSNTFFATAAAVIHAGGRVRFADVDAGTLALSRQTVEQAATGDTVGVIHVHIGGYVSHDTADIAELCRQRGWWFVEDAAHAHGASCDGRLAGTFGVAGAFSFYPTKVVTAGEGGCIVTSDDRIRDEAVIYRDQGKAGFLGGDHVRMGAAWRMSEVHAAIGAVHLRRLDQFIAHRSAIAQAYHDAFAGCAGITPIVPGPNCVSNYYKYVALLDSGIDRASFKRALLERHGVSASGEVYAKPLHDQPVFTGIVHQPLPVTDDVCARHVCLPIHSDMTEAEASYVIHSVIEVLDHRG